MQRICSTSVTSTVPGSLYPIAKGSYRVGRTDKTRSTKSIALIRTTGAGPLVSWVSGMTGFTYLLKKLHSNNGHLSNPLLQTGLLLVTNRWFMKAFVLTFSILLAVLSCNRETEPLPAESWSTGCVELSPHNTEYRLSGMCCAYMILPLLRLNGNQAFSVEGRYNVFTGAGYAETPVRVNGRYVRSAKTLILDYKLNGQVITHTLTPGRATVACYCGCD